MAKSDRSIARKIAHRYLRKNDAVGWFEELYVTANSDPGIVPWADMAANPNLVEWLEHERITGEGKSVLLVGCGLGDDAEELAKRGFITTAFDISRRAIMWCNSRFPNTCVKYLVADLFSAPGSWNSAFDFVIESYTLQVLPPELRQKAIEKIAGFVSRDGMLLVIARGREPNDDPGKMPWPLTKPEIRIFQSFELREVLFEDYMDKEIPPVRRFRVTYVRS